MYTNIKGTKTLEDCNKLKQEIIKVQQEILVLMGKPDTKVQGIAGDLIGCGTKGFTKTPKTPNTIDTEQLIYDLQRD